MGSKLNMVRLLMNLHERLDDLLDELQPKEATPRVVEAGRLARVGHLTSVRPFCSTAHARRLLGSLSHSYHSSLAHSNMAPSSSASKRGGGANRLSLSDPLTAALRQGQENESAAEREERLRREAEEKRVSDAVSLLLLLLLHCARARASALEMWPAEVTGEGA